MIWQIILNKKKDRYEITQVEKPIKGAFQNYQFAECEDAEGTYVSEVLKKTDNFSMDYIKDFDDCTNF